MKIFYTDEFIKKLERLPTETQKFYLNQENLLRENWRGPKLHTKKLRGRPIVFSFRVTRSYRALFYFRSSDEIILFAIGHRKDVYKKSGL